MTPLPWAAEPDNREGMEWNVHIVEAARPHMRIAFTSNGPDSEANAAFIVQAVNNHDKLVQALRDVLDQTGSVASPEIVRAIHLLTDLIAPRHTNEA